MFKNYFKTAFRSLTRNKTYTIINIAGLAVGIAVCTVIFVIIQFHSSFDDFHSKKDRIYRVLTEYHHADVANIFYGPGVPFPMPKGLRAAFPQVEAVAPIVSDHDDQVLILDDNGSTIKKFKEQRGVFFTEPSLFSIFDFPLIAGSYSSLKDPNNVLLAKETAEKYFGDWRSAMGKTIRLTSSYSTDLLKVSGILAPIPANTDLQFKLVVSLGTGFTGTYIAKSDNWDGTSSDYRCFILLPRNVSVQNFNSNLRAWSKKMESPENKDSHIIQPLAAIHYDTETGDFSNKTISHGLINVLWLIGAFILLIACVNFVNLSTAQAINRAKEVGVRKVMGSNSWQLRLQFLAETFLIVIAALALAVILSLVAIPFVNRTLELSLSFNPAHNTPMVLFLVVVAVLVTALAGLYPSFVQSRFNPVTALKSKLSSKSVKGISLRRGLVVFQFIIAQALIIGTLIMISQMNYFINQPLGFDKRAIINVSFPQDSISHTKLDYLRKQLGDINGVENVSYSSNTPVEDDNDMWTTLRFNRAVKETDFYAITKFADNAYVPAYRLRLVAGRNLEPSDTVREFLVNEMLAKNLGYKDPQAILNKEVSIWDDHLKGTVVGVLKNFNDRSFRRDLAPLLLSSFKNMYSQAGIRLTGIGMPAAIRQIEKLWDRTFPDFVFEYKFLDDKVESFYKQENQLSVLYKVFAAIAIFLSCLGLYGLASFMAVQRIKEVGIRKVLGAGAGNIVYLFSREFMLLIGIAFVIATPIAWYYMHKWLEGYVYRIDIGWWMFVVGGLLAVMIALITVSFEALKAAMANPVKSLRTE